MLSELARGSAIPFPVTAAAAEAMLRDSAEHDIPTEGQIQEILERARRIRVERDLALATRIQIRLMERDRAQSLAPDERGHLVPLVSGRLDATGNLARDVANIEGYGLLEPGLEADSRPVVLLRVRDGDVPPLLPGDLLLAELTDSTGDATCLLHAGPSGYARVTVRASAREQTGLTGSPAIARAVAWWPATAGSTAESS